MMKRKQKGGCRTGRNVKPGNKREDVELERNANPENKREDVELERNVNPENKRERNVIQPNLPFKIYFPEGYN